MRNKRKSIGIDLDSTLNKLDEKWLELYNKDYNDNLTTEDLTEWNIENLVKPECGVKIFDYLYLPNFFFNLDIREYAAETVEWLKKYYDIYIVTAYYPSTCVDKVNWVKKHLLSVNPKNIIFCNKKGTLNLDYLIDDGSHNIKDFKQIGIVFDRAHNRHLKYYDRVYCWQDIKNYFEKELLK